MKESLAVAKTTTAAVPPASGISANTSFARTTSESPGNSVVSAASVDSAAKPVNEKAVKIRAGNNSDE